MRTLLAVIGAGLMACSAAAASTPQERPYQQEHRPTAPTPRPEPARPPMAQHGPNQHAMEHRAGDERYGRWENDWGRRPPAPPRHWTRHEDWYRHVHACQTRYRTYNPATDHYTVRKGVTARCRL